MTTARDPANYNIGGSSIAINEGSITTGDGIVSVTTTTTAGPTIACSIPGASSRSTPAEEWGTTSYARNSGELAVGDLSVGMMVSGQGFSALNPAAPTGITVNEGIISTGDNSSGMFTMGTNATSVNSGSVTIGDYDISAFSRTHLHADVFAIGRNGVGSTATFLSEVINTGTIITGDGKVGASAPVTPTISATGRA